MNKKTDNRFSHGGELKDKNIKYDFSVNINPFGLPDGVKQVLIDSLQAFTDYPDPQCSLLRNMLAEKEGVSADQIVCGNGASDIIYRICEAFDIKRALIPVPAFSEYERALDLHGSEAEYIYTRAEDDFALTTSEFKEWISGRGSISSKEISGSSLNLNVSINGADRYKLPYAVPDAVFLCDPTNPSGKLLEPGTIKEVYKWCRNNGALLIVDECFLEFNENRNSMTAVNLIRSNDSGIIVINAFTKIYGMAGLRLGYAVCSDSKTAHMISERGPHWSVSGPAQAAGMAALKEHEYLKKSVQFIKKERSRVGEALLDMLKEKGDIFRIFHSDANYILFTAPAGLAAAMAEEGIAIRDCGNYTGLSERHEYFYRIAIRSEAENDIMLDSMRRCLKWL